MFDSIATNTVNDFNSIPTQQNFSVNRIVRQEVVVNFDMQYHIANNDVIKFLLDSFINQRKMYRYYKAETKYEENLIDEDQFDKIENSCIISLKKINTQYLKEKIIFLYDMMEKYYPEEIKYMDNDDLADILGISKNTMKKVIS